MELESEEGAKIPINNGSATEIGRDLGLGLGFRPYSSDRTVSRRHLSLHPATGQESSEPMVRVSFEVIGKNPILVRHEPDGGERIYRNSESGELSVGDSFSLSLKNPSFFVIKRREGGEEEEEAAAAAAEKRRVLDAVERREKRTLERRREREERTKREISEGEGDEEEFVLVLSEIDPVKEFGFLVKGHEFDHYPKVNCRHWNWFLDEPRENSDDHVSDGEGTRLKGKKGGRRKKKGLVGGEDEEWTGESEEEKGILMRSGSGKRLKYSTRSKDPKKPRKDVKARKEEVEEENEEDETLGGFIVSEEEDEGTEEQESEEEELEDEEDDDE